MLPVKSILMPTDFSAQSAFALNYARVWAQVYGASLHLVHIIEPVVFPIDWGYTPVDLSDVEKEYTKAANEELSRTLEDLRSSGINVITAILHGGRASEEIIRYAAEHSIDMICIATHGRGGMEHFLFGSTTERVLRKAPCPVLVVRTNG